MIRKSFSRYQRLVSLAAVALLFLADTQAATVSGTVVTRDGKKIAAILTLHDLSTTRTVGSTPFDHQFSSKSDGTFSLSNVPPGQYEICADAPNAAVLDPCEWTRGGAPRITIKGTAASPLPVMVEVKVETGYMLQVHLNDPQQLLPSSLGSGGGSSVLLRLLSTDHRTHNFRLMGASANAQDRFVIIPYNQPVTLAVDSPSTVKGAPSLLVTGSTSLGVPSASSTGTNSPGAAGATGLQPGQGGPPASPPGIVNIPGAASFQTVNGSAKVPIVAVSGQSAAPIVLNVAKP